MSTTNKNGLSRYIPADVRAAIRQRCRFGCVFCRRAPVEYDHFDPEFVDAVEHSAQGIALLCANHHDLRTKGVLTGSHVAARLSAMVAEDLRPVTYEFAPPDLRANWKLRLGHLTFHPGGRLTVNGSSFFSVACSADGSVTVSARFQDAKGKLIAEIEENSFVTGSSAVADFVCEGNRLSWKLKDGSQYLEAKVDGPSETIEILGLNMFAEKARLIVADRRFQLGLHFKSGWRDILGTPFDSQIIDASGEIRLGMWFGSGGDGVFMLTTPDGISVKPG